MTDPIHVLIVDDQQPICRELARLLVKLTTVLRKRWPDLPVILLTTFDDATIIRRSLTAGAAVFLRNTVIHPPEGLTGTSHFSNVSLSLTKDIVATDAGSNKFGRSVTVSTCANTEWLSTPPLASVAQILTLKSPDSEYIYLAMGPPFLTSKTPSPSNNQASNDFCECYNLTL